MRPKIALIVTACAAASLLSCQAKVAGSDHAAAPALVAPDADYDELARQTLALEQLQASGALPPDFDAQLAALRAAVAAAPIAEADRTALTARLELLQSRSGSAAAASSGSASDAAAGGLSAAAVDDAIKHVLSTMNVAAGGLPSGVDRDSILGRINDLLAATAAGTTQQAAAAHDIAALQADLKAAGAGTSGLDDAVATVQAAVAALATNDGEAAAQLATVQARLDAVEAGLAADLQLRIITPGAGGAAPVAAVNLQVGATATVRAALYTLAGDFVRDAADVVWSVVGTGGTITGNATAVFMTTQPGSAQIVADYVGADAAVKRARAVTGLVTVSSNAVPAAITASGGVSQTGVTGNTLAANLEVRVVDGFGLPVPGVAVAFSAPQGGGAFVGSNPALTNADGRASIAARLGDLAGANVFRAAPVAAPGLTADFAATGVPGAVTQVTFAVAPGNAFANAPFGQQPRVEVRDAHGNLVIGAAGTLSLAAATGCGTVTGTTTATLTAGSAVYSDTGCDTSGPATLKATYGAVDGVSASFTVATPPPGACQRNDAAFQTAGGGCTDLAGGLIYSKATPGAMVFSDAIWDQDYAGNAATADAFDLGRTNDFDGNVTGGTTDQSVVNYCHSLNEGGQQDWRLPTKTELEQAAVHSIAGSPPYLAGVAAHPYWTSSLVGYGGSCTAGNFETIDPTTGAAGYACASGSSWVVCVRGARAAPTKIALVSGPKAVGVGNTQALAQTPLVVAIAEAGGKPVNRSGVTVTLSATSLGALGGTVSATTDRSGRAAFAAFTLDTAGSAQLTVASAGLTPLVQALRVGAFPQTCAVDDAAFQTADGGCKSLASGLVWSAPAGPMTWHDAIWGYNAGTFNDGDPTDADDASRTNDYAGANPGGAADSSTVNYCHQLTEGGKTDWRVPTYAELANVRSAGAATHFGVLPDGFFWSSSHDGCSAVQVLNLLTGDFRGGCGGVGRDGTQYALCVRP